MKNLKGWVKFNESMDAAEDKKCDCGQEDCDICNPAEKVEEKKKAPKMKADKKEDKEDKKKADKKDDKKGPSDKQKAKLPWLNKK